MIGYLHHYTIARTIISHIDGKESTFTNKRKHRVTTVRMDSLKAVDFMLEITVKTGTNRESTLR